MKMPNKKLSLRKVWLPLRNAVVNFGLLFYYSVREFFRDQCPTRAAALTYFTLLALVPLLVVMFAFFKTFGGEALIDNSIKPLLFQVLSTGTGEVVSNAIDNLIQQTKAGALGAVGFIFLVLTAFSLIEQTEFTLNAIWAEKKKRSIFQRWLFYWGMLTVFPLLVGVSFSASAYLGSLKEVQELSQRVLQSGYKLLPLTLQGLAFFLLYVFMPRTRVKFLPALFGAAVASILWELLKSAYLFYTSSAINYNLVYGSIAALPLFMIWLFISWFVVLFGAEIAFVGHNFKIIRQTRKQMEVPFTLYETLGLELLVESARKFLYGGKPVNPEDFAEERALPQYLVTTALDKLTASGLVKFVNNEIILSRDPDTLTVQDAVEAIRMSGTAYPHFAQSGDLLDMHTFIEKMDLPSQELRREWSIKRVLNEMKNSE